MKKNILQLLEETTKRYPRKTAFSDETGEVLYEDVVRYAKAIGTYISKFEIKRSAVAVIQEKSKEALISYMGVVYSGNFYVPIDTKMPDERIQKILDVVAPRVIIVDDYNYQRAKALMGQAKVIGYKEIINCAIDEDKLKEIRQKAIDTDPVYALFTSGSTGIPKGVVCCHRSVIDYADWLIETFDFDDKTVFGNQTQFYFSMSVLDIYATIRSGAELHIIPQHLFTFPIELLRYMNEKKINSIYWVPTALCIVANLRALKKVEMPYLKKVLFAGEAMPTKQLNIWKNYLPDAKFVNLFGPTEITDIGLYYVLDRELADDEPIPIGTTCDNVDAIVLDDNGNEITDGRMGELCIRGSFLALGYYGDFDKTNSVFIQNPSNPYYPDIIYKTGDLVSVNEYGEFIYHGRKDFQIKHKGNRIELGEIETAVSSLSDVDSCVCIYDENKGRIICFYVGLDEININFAEALTTMIPEYMVPNRFYRMDSLPNNSNGKIDRKQLKEDYLNGLFENQG